MTNPDDLRHREFYQFGRNKWKPGDKFEVVPRPVFTDDDLARLDAHFRILRPTFPVRCRHKVCSTLRGPLKEKWCNMITVPGVLLRRMECESCGLQYLIFPWGGKFRDSCLVQAEVMDQKKEDRFLLGYPAAHFSWRHCYSVLDKFLEMNRAWTLELGDWENCRTMCVRIIAVRDADEPRDLSRSVTGPVQGLEKALIQGSVPVPQYAKRHGHTQEHINRIIESIAGYDGPRDLGLDAHDDQAWACSGGSDQNRPPPGAWSSDMTGCLTGPAYIGQYEETSSESSYDDFGSDRSQDSDPEASEDFSRPYELHR